MPTPFFNDPARVERLVRAAIRLQGTPWGANSCVPGVAMSCHLAVVWALQQAGFPIDPKSVPRQTASWARHQTRSVIVEALAARPEFHPLWTRPENPASSLVRHSLGDGGIQHPETSLQPGDLVGFKCGLCIHHLGIILPDDRFFQCLEGMGAVILSMQEKAFKDRLAAAWRPLDIGPIDPVSPISK